MQFKFDCENLLNTDSEGFAIIEGSYQNNIRPGYLLYVNEILDSIGYAASKVCLIYLKFIGSRS